MGSLAEELLAKHEEIVHRWYEAWRRSEHPHPELGEAALKDSLPTQLKLIGEQLRDLEQAEEPTNLWKELERLDTEKRVAEEIPIEEVVQEYGLAVDTVRDWIEAQHITVPFEEYSYFYRALFELTAEAVRRYSRRQAELVAKGRGAYLAGIMHQLRNPLSALSMTVEVMERGDRPPNPATMSKLRRNVRRIRLLVDGVLRIERFRPEELPVRPEELYPARLVDEIMSDHEQDAIRKGLQFEAHVNRTLRMTVDSDLFVDALGNLVQNAVKYTSAGFVTVEAEERREDVIFHVRDSGPGIPENKRRTLLREVQPGSTEGTGLGLLIAQHAAKALGGEIGFECATGKGSEFWLRLPRTVIARTGGEPGGDV